MVSHQTIIPGDQCIILPISQQTSYERVEIINRRTQENTKKYGYCASTCYSTAFWGYSGPIITGKYDDYGCFDIGNTESNINNMISFFNFLYERSCDVLQGNNQYHDHSLQFVSLYNPKNQYTFTELVHVWDKIWEVSQQSRLFVLNYNNEPVNLAFAVVHRVCVDYMIEQVSTCENLRGQSLEPLSYFRNYINTKYDKLVEVFKDSLTESMSYIASCIAGMDDFGIGDKEGTYIRNWYLDSRRPIIKFILDYFKNNPETTSFNDDAIDELCELLSDQIEHRYISMCIDRYNIKLSPMVYTGQDYSNEIGNSFLSLIKNVNERVRQLNYNEDEDEDE